ncbi:hypothetical protein, partial [Streptomyces hilarionis]|uniref:hypothetical protein n=1 Tax=Streptomyces hilarionis TaxID=2839954 RepID=UPI002119CFE2
EVDFWFSASKETGFVCGAECALNSLSIDDVRVDMAGSPAVRDIQINWSEVGPRRGGNASGKSRCGESDKADGFSVRH